MKKEAQSYGRAYAFFDCNASKEQIGAELPTIRQCVKTPSNLELSLTEGVENFWKNKKSVITSGIALKEIPQLISIIQEAQDSGMRYVLEATCPNATNKKTADELASVLNQAYQSPLYADKEEFRGGIVYEDMGKYVFRE